MLPLNHNIEFKNIKGKKYRLRLLHSVEIESSCLNLVDTATIVIPEMLMNNVLNIENYVERGTEVNIQLGYKKLETEFVGYVTEVINSNGSLSIKCEDALFLFRKSIPNKIFKPAPVKDILNYVISKVDDSYKLVMDVDYGITYEKFTIYQAEAYDVLAKLQDELKADIFFDTAKKELHFHAPYKMESGKVTYDMSRNIEKSKLEYKAQINNKIEVIVESTGSDGKITKVTKGTPGGLKEHIKVGAMSKDDMSKIADSFLANSKLDKYVGSIDAWLIPFVKPTYRAKFIDNDYPERNGSYYVNSVTTRFSPSGGQRTIEFGIKL